MDDEEEIETPETSKEELLRLQTIKELQKASIELFQKARMQELQDCEEVQKAREITDMWLRLDKQRW